MKTFLRLSTSILLCVAIIASLTLINVKTAEAATIKLNKTKLTLDVGKSYTLKITGTTKAVKWASSNKNVAAVSTAGKVTAKSGGSAVITATVSSKKYTCNVTVNEKISDDWKDLELIIDGHLYKMLFDYKQLQDNGWDFDITDYGYDSYSMDPGDMITSTIYLENSKYDSDITVGFQNTDTKAKDIKKCKIWSIDIINTYAKNPVSFVLPGGITQGSSAKEITAAYGKPDDTYRADDLGYSVYYYQIDKGMDNLRLVIYDKKGLVEVEYTAYE